MYRIYTTDGFVLRSHNIGEANKLLSIYTRDLGRVEARAQNLRGSSSKLRYGLQPYSFCIVSLVYGKGGWRVTTSTPVSNVFFEARNAIVQEHFAQVVKLVERLIPGEQKDARVYSIIQSVASYLGKPDLTSQEIANVGSLAYLRILYQLGYIDGDNERAELLKSEAHEPFLDYISKNRKEVLKEINISLEETGL